VATNDLIILIAFVPIVKFLLGNSNVRAVDTLILSVVCSWWWFHLRAVCSHVPSKLGEGIGYLNNTFIKNLMESPLMACS
jgi:ACR3 family arsenite transporter